MRLHFLVHCLWAALLVVLSSRGYARSLPAHETLPLSVEQKMKIPTGSGMRHEPGTARGAAIAVGSTRGKSNSTALTGPESTMLVARTGTGAGTEGSAGNGTAAGTGTAIATGKSTAIATGKGTAPGGPSVVRHILRKRELYVDTPYDFHTTHLFCDMDIRNRHLIIWFFPNHCIWVWNNKYVHEGFYRLYKMYQFEGFIFGQYNIRLFQWEFESFYFGYVWSKLIPPELD
ncbi:uncharacterized protein LOC117584550 isoform X2 [Drosophila guanche]|uniref:Uncharacterized protein n=1 Tax=Drosophila guanche TaxID=7266 RepID=A0A3B0JI56_DROGU|nr:uncharacterized protein LOC117584550 isoform X2 [Drosophila guanche]SPP72906.1 Hypothetical predicted protein [Drosophila guanche]